MMDQHHLEEGLRNVLLAEPPLGIDPDRVADLAARTQRNRRRVTGASIGTFAVIGVAAAVVFTSGAGPGPVQAAGPGTAHPSTNAPSSRDDLKDQSKRNVAHLRYVLPRLVPEATNIKVSYTHEVEGNTMNVTITFTDSAGPATVTMLVASASAFEYDAKEMRRGCAGPPVHTTDGGTLDCKQVHRPDGSVLMLEEFGMEIGITSDQIQVIGNTASHLRTDGVGVNVTNERGLTRARNPLTDDQLVKLATDPALTLHDPHK